MPLPLFWQQFCPYLLLNNQYKYLFSEIFIQANDVLVLWWKASWPHKSPERILGTSNHTLRITVGSWRVCTFKLWIPPGCAIIISSKVFGVTGFVTLTNIGMIESVNQCLIRLGKAHCHLNFFLPLARFRIFPYIYWLIRCCHRHRWTVPGDRRKSL